MAAQVADSRRAPFAINGGLMNTAYVRPESEPS
jgi:hypothetical protein